MAVFLKILVILGIVLLSILGIILLAVLLVLFVPIRYKANGSFKDSKPAVTAKVTWLLHIVSVVYTLGEKNPLIIKIFGIKLKSNARDTVPDDFDDDFGEEYESVSASSVPARPSKPIAEKAEDKPSITTDATEDVPKTEESTVNEEVHETPKPVNSEVKTENAVDTNPESHKEKDAKSESPNKNFENQSFYVKIKKYIEIIKSIRFKKAFEYSKNKIFKLLKHICPRKLYINGEVGFDDPSVTGRILVITSALKPILGKNVRIVGNFEEPIISIEGKLRGHITVFRVLWTGAVLYFNKNIRKIIKMFREV